MSIYDYQEQLLWMQYYSADSMPLKSLIKGRLEVEIPVAEKYLSEALMMMQKSNSMDLLLQHCIKAKISLSFDSMLPADGSVFYEIDNQLHVSEQNKTFDIDMHNVRLGQMVIGLASGLRQAWHYHKGNGFHPELSVRDLLHICRSADADTIVFVTLVCWELKEQGNNYPWKQWVTGENSDVAKAFELAQAENGSTKNTKGLNKALQASYRQWFHEDDRGAESEHHALEKLDRVLMTCRQDDEDISWIGRNELTTNIWSRLGEIPGCQNYLQQKKLLKHGYRDEPLDAFNRVHFEHVLNDIERS